MGAMTSTARYKIPAVALDDLIAGDILPVPDLIKMDVGGAESSILEGARDLMRRNKTVLFIALHGEAQKRKCMETLFSLSYRIFLLDGTEIKDTSSHCDEIYAVPQGL